MRVATIILAAGQGSRMKSKTPKVLHRLGGRPMVAYGLELAAKINPHEIYLVLGHQAAQVEASLASYRETVPFYPVLQTEQRGTGHAVLTALPSVPESVDYVLILYGDTPLLQRETIELLLQKAFGNNLAFLSTRLLHPKGYGRILRNPQTQEVERIVEERDCTKAQTAISEVNAGIYAVKASFLRKSLSLLTPDNAQKELYLTDIVELAAKEHRVEAIEVSSEEVQGINDRVDLARAEQTLRYRINEGHMRQGVTLLDPATTYIEPGVRIGTDVWIGSNVQITGGSTIGDDCIIESGCVIHDAKIAADCHIKPYTVIYESQIETGTKIGPFAHLRPDNYLGPYVRIGNFVELKKTFIGKGSKANHLTYLGDAEVGEQVNIGCGTITCNYDGYQKHRTIIEDGAFIGSDTQLVAPVRVGKEAVVAAGTTVTQDVPEGALALSRTPQTHRLGYREKKRAERMKSPG